MIVFVYRSYLNFNSSRKEVNFIKSHTIEKTKQNRSQYSITPFSWDRAAFMLIKVAFTTQIIKTQIKHNFRINISLITRIFSSQIIEVINRQSNKRIYFFYLELILKEATLRQNLSKETKLAKNARTSPILPSATN
jgi:hypothetical protein